MSYGWEISLESIRTVARGLGDMLVEVVFVGGSTLGFYVDDIPEKLEDIRGSEDVDVVVEVSSKLAFSKFEESLRQRGFKNDISKGAPICRFLYAGIKVDFIPTNPSILSFSNRWYLDGIGSAIDVDIGSGMSVKIFSSPYFLASKIEAFKDRGKKQGEYMFSRDLEDIFTIFDGRSKLISELANAEKGLREYLLKETAALIVDREFLDALPAFVKPDSRALDRIRTVKSRMQLTISTLSGSQNSDDHLPKGDGIG